MAIFFVIDPDLNVAYGPFANREVAALYCEEVNLPESAIDESSRGLPIRTASESWLEYFAPSLVRNPRDFNDALLNAARSNLIQCVRERAQHLRDKHEGSKRAACLRLLTVIQLQGYGPLVAKRHRQNLHAAHVIYWNRHGVAGYVIPRRAFRTARVQAAKAGFGHV